MGPAGWAVIAENAQRVAFGADLVNADNTAYAGYSIFGAGSLTAVPGSETPDRAVAKSLTGFGRIPVKFGTRQQLASNVFLVEYQSATNHGVAFWEVFPAGRGGYMIVMRTAGTGAVPGQWQKKGAEAMAVARSLHCQVPNVPPAPDPPALNPKPKRAARAAVARNRIRSTISGSTKSTWPTILKLGLNYWVSPSHDWINDGPEGPGYYAPRGNGIYKLDPGYSQ